MESRNPPASSKQPADMAEEKPFNSMDLLLKIIAQRPSSLEMHTPKTSSKQKTNTVEEEKPFRLMDLAPELVLKILEHAVVYSNKDKPISVTKAVCTRTQAGVLVQSERKYRAASVRLLQPAIIRSCRMLREEGLKLFYGGNVFSVKQIYQGGALADWVYSIGPTNATMIQQLYLSHIGYLKSRGPNNLVRFLSIIDEDLKRQADPEIEYRVQLRDVPTDSLWSHLSGAECCHFGLATYKMDAEEGYLLRREWARKWAGVKVPEF